MGDESIEDKAARRGGRKAGVTDTEIEERDRELVRDRARGKSWPYIAHKHDLSVSRCMHIHAEWRRGNPQEWKGRDPIDIVEQQLDRLEAWVEQLAELTDRTEDAVTVAAVRTQMDLTRRAADLMQDTGILPHDLGTMRIQIDVQQLGVRLLAALNANGATLEMKRAIIHELRSGEDTVDAEAEVVEDD